MLSVKTFISAWNKFFFEERPTEGIALFRIIWFGLIFAYYLFDTGNIRDYYGPQAIVSLNTARSQLPYLHLNVFNLFQHDYSVTTGLFILYGVALFFSMIGFLTRYSIIVSLVLMTSFHQRNIWLLSSAEVLMRTITLYMIFSPCGHSLSVDSYLGRYFKEFRKKKISSVWCLRLIQIQLSVVYLWTFWHKLKGETWFDGSAVYYATRLESMTNFTIPFLMDSAWFMRFSTWGTLAIEFALGSLIWFKEFRKPLIYAGILFHVGIEYMMSIPFFELLMISLLINFFTPEELKAFVTAALRKAIAVVEESTMPSELKNRIISTVKG